MPSGCSRIKRSGTAAVRDPASPLEAGDELGDTLLPRSIELDEGLLADHTVCSECVALLEPNDGGRKLGVDDLAGGVGIRGEVAGKAEPLAQTADLRVGVALAECAVFAQRLPVVVGRQPAVAGELRFADS